MTSIAQLPQFGLTSPPAADLCHAVDLDGSHGVRIATSAQTSGLFVPAENYIYMDMAAWFDDAQSKTYGVSLMEIGRSDGIAIGYHEDSLGDGQPAIIVAIANTDETAPTGVYCARFHVPSLYSAASAKEYHGISIEYIYESGFRLWLNGTEIGSASVGGTDYDFRPTGAYLNNSGIGASFDINTIRSRGAVHFTGVCGSTTKWEVSTGTEAGFLQGAIGYCRIESEVGVASALLPLVNDIGDDTANNTPTLRPGAGSPSFIRIIPWLFVDENTDEILDTIDASASLNASKTIDVRVHNFSDSGMAGALLTSETLGGIVDSVAWFDSSGTPTNLAAIKTAGISAGDYKTARLTLDTSSLGDNQAGTFRLLGTTNDLTINVSLDVANQVTGLTMPFESGLWPSNLTSPISGDVHPVLGMTT
jgi:hypothetical protein